MLYLVRHGENVDNFNGVINDYNNDKPLTELGFRQAKEVGEKIRLHSIKIDTIFASPLIRARQTAETIANELGYDTNKIIYNELLKERDFKKYAGKLLADIPKLAKEFNDEVLTSQNINYFRGRNGAAETYEEVRERAMKFLKSYDKTIYGNALVVSHGELEKMMYCAHYNLSIEYVLNKFLFKNCEILQLIDSRIEPESPYLDFNQI